MLAPHGLILGCSVSFVEEDDRQLQVHIRILNDGLPSSISSASRTSHYGSAAHESNLMLWTERASARTQQRAQHQSSFFFHFVYYIFIYLFFSFLEKKRGEVDATRRFYANAMHRLVGCSGPIQHSLTARPRDNFFGRPTSPSSSWRRVQKHQISLLFSFMSQ